MVRRSFLFAFADKSVVVGVAILMMALVSRILSPAEVGLFIVASTVIILIEALRDFGIGAFLVSERDLTREVTRTAVTLIACMSLVLGGATLFFAPLIAQFYGDPALGVLIRIAAIAFVLAPISTPLIALLRRDMKFGQVAVINIVAGIANAVTTISLALAGLGTLSLVIGAVVAAGLTAVGALICRPDWWIFWPCLRGWRRVVPFGAWSSVVTLLGMLIDAFPRLVLGRMLGFGAVGLYARAVSIAQLPDRLILSAVQPVLLPALSTHARENRALSGPFLMGLAYVSGLQWPALAMIALLADPIVQVLLGDQWLDVVSLVRIVAPALFCLFPIYLCYPTLVALGRVRDMAVAMMILLPPCFAIMMVASTFGLTAMAASLFVTGPIQVVVLLGFVRRHVPFGLRDFGAQMVCSGGVTLATVVLPVAILAIAGSWSDMAVGTFFLTVSGACVGWIAGVVCLGHPLKRELDAIRAALRRKRARRVRLIIPS